MQHELQSLVSSVTSFTQAFAALLDASVLAQLGQQHGPKPRGQKPRLSGAQLVSALIFHVLAGAGTLAVHVQQLTGLKLSDSALSQRRTAAGLGVFEAIVQAALHPLAVLQEHPQAFYHGWRLIGMDGSQFSVSNTPQLLGRLSKAASRRLRAAFAKVPMSWLMELGTHAPVAAVVGAAQESEWELSHRLLSQLQTGWLVLADRLYGVAAFVNELLIATQRMGSHFLVRVRQNVKVSVRQVLSDGSALVAVPVADPWHPNRKRGCILDARDRGAGAAIPGDLGNGALVDRPVGRAEVSRTGTVGVVCATVGDRTGHSRVEAGFAGVRVLLQSPHCGDGRAGDFGGSAGPGRVEPGAPGGRSRRQSGTVAD